MKTQKNKKNRWYNEECKIAIEEMKKAREKWLMKGKRENEEQEYHHKRKEAHKIIRNKKKLYIKSVIESILVEEDQNHKNTRKIYQTINQFKKGYQHKFNVITNKKGELSMNTKQRAEIWKEYVDTLLDTKKTKEIN
jgi:deoxyribodipyrimidine photolyase